MTFKKLVTILIPLIFLNSYPSKSDEFKSLFGIRLYENAEKYFKKSYINSNKLKNKETFDGFYDIEVTKTIKIKNPFLSKYWIVIDQSNSIKQIAAEQNIIDLQKCNNFKDQLLKVFISKYNFKFDKKEFTHKDFFTDQNYTKVDDNKSLYIKCVDTFSTKKINLIISLESKHYLNRKKEYYESGF
tara:strand:- start:57 stop:614 length:558 start_codon:yes stop_codon:yes gene_type:complete